MAGGGFIHAHVCASMLFLWAAFALAISPADCVRVVDTLSGTRIEDLNLLVLPRERAQTSASVPSAASGDVQVHLEVNHWQGFTRAAALELSLPPALRAALARGESLSPEHLASLGTWAITRLRSQLEKWKGASNGRLLSLMTVFSGEQMFRSEEIAMIRAIRSDVAFFSPGHGMPGGVDFRANVFLQSGVPVVLPNHFEIRIGGDALINYYAQMPGVRGARVIFFSSCNAGLPALAPNGTVQTPAAAQRLARESGVPVIAPLGNLSTNIISGRLQLGVRNAETNRMLGADEAFMRFYPDDRPPERVTFAQVLEAIGTTGDTPSMSYRQPQ